MSLTTSDGEQIQLGQDNFAQKSKIDLNGPYQKLVGFSALLNSNKQVEGLSAVLYDCQLVLDEDSVQEYIRWQDTDLVNQDNKEDKEDGQDPDRDQEDSTDEKDSDDKDSNDIEDTVT